MTVEAVVFVSDSSRDLRLGLEEGKNQRLLRLVAARRPEARFRPLLVAPPDHPLHVLHVAEVDDVGRLRDAREGDVLLGEEVPEEAANSADEVGDEDVRHHVQARLGQVEDGGGLGGDLVDRGEDHRRQEGGLGGGVGRGGGGR